MFAANHAPSSSNSFYCDPQMVKKLLGTEDKIRHTAARHAHVPQAKVRRVDSQETSETAIKFVEPEKPQRRPKGPTGKRQKAKAICSAALKKLKPTR
ncbi:uncharacterized protein LTHEOB_7764 [Lasiodiplodia theobromae]|uniref:uncharacterized protein n=1 Tax=Lasiodiplodia theobromae TaxID=45133 RepID=UPI0015C3AA9C|nr:uncharacterized protein LTHEOB_7764 [Lasiodiplodia theobromae]KAF4542082.1 hypothetical protein LTHEOB_7764 [Lasiodiplodia theobromae]